MPDDRWSIEDALAAKEPAPGVCHACGRRPLADAELTWCDVCDARECIECHDDEETHAALDLPNEETPPEEA